MAIKMVPDLGAPLAVAAVNIVSRQSIPDYHDYIVYAMTAAGYVGGWMGWGGDFLKQMGVSSLPLTADKIYERVRGGATSPARRVAFRRSAVSRYPAPATESEFRAGPKLT